MSAADDRSGRFAPRPCERGDKPALRRSFAELLARHRAQPFARDTIADSDGSDGA